MPPRAASVPCRHAHTAGRAWTWPAIYTTPRPRAFPRGSMADHLITRTDQLEAIYGTPVETALLKERPALTPEYRPFIEHAPFMVLATAGPEGLDCSPRGDAPGF